MALAVQRYDGATAFWQAAAAWLLEAEAENNLIIGLALRNGRNASFAVPDEYWATIVDTRAGAGERSVVGCAFRTPPLRPAVSRMPDAAAALLCDDLLDRYGELPGVTGAAESVRAFADRWVSRVGGECVTHMALRIHQLDAVTFSESPPAGVLRHVAESEAGLMRKWLTLFAGEARAELEPEKVARFMLAEGRARIWDDGGPRCLVAAARDTPSCGTINAVYTPVEHRRHGYATAAVAALSDELLRGGKRCCALYTDLANPTSNSIYARVGYRPVRDDLEVSFVPRAG